MPGRYQALMTADNVTPARSFLKKTPTETKRRKNIVRVQFFRVGFGASTALSSDSVV